MKKSMILTVAFIAIGYAAFAQTTNNCPVDGGLSFLVIAGVAGYGAKKAADKKKQAMEKSESSDK